MLKMWTHSICEDCWFKQHPEGKMPIRINQAHRHIEICCFCLSPHASGIYVRQDPSTVKCEGVHTERTE